MKLREKLEVYVLTMGWDIGILKGYAGEDSKTAQRVLNGVKEELEEMLNEERENSNDN